MNEWTEEELSIIETYRKQNYTYYQIQGLLKERGYIRTYDSIKKVASLRFGRKVNSGYSEAPAKVETKATQATGSFKSHRVLVIGDIHAPFNHRYYLDFLLDTYRAWQCDTVVCIGDEVDFHALSKYPQDPNGYGAGDELINAITALRPYYEAFPDVQVVTSNHTARPLKKAFEAGIPTQFLKDYKTFLDAPKGWSWSNVIEIDNVNYIHGEGYSGALGHHKAAMNSMRSTVIGHIHSHGGVTYIQTEFQRIFGLNVGCGVDIEAYAFAYGKNCAFKPTLGCGVVLNGKEAYFIPMSGF
jgi:predicted phosphodiesterase